MSPSAAEFTALVLCYNTMMKGKHGREDVIKKSGVEKSQVIAKVKEEIVKYCGSPLDAFILGAEVGIAWCKAFEMGEKDGSGEENEEGKETGETVEGGTEGEKAGEEVTGEETGGEEIGGEEIGGEEIGGEEIGGEEIGGEEIGEEETGENEAREERRKQRRKQRLQNKRNRKRK